MRNHETMAPTETIARHQDREVARFKSDMAAFLNRSCYEWEMDHATGIVICTLWSGARIDFTIPQRIAAASLEDGIDIVDVGDDVLADAPPR